MRTESATLSSSSPASAGWSGCWRMYIRSASSFFAALRMFWGAALPVVSSLASVRRTMSVARICAYPPCLFRLECEVRRMGGR